MARQVNVSVCNINVYEDMARHPRFDTSSSTVDNAV